jgi:cytoskeletal protein RodZ
MRTIQSLSFSTWIRFFGIVVLIGTIAWYVQFQARNILEGPTIDLTDEYVPVQHERHVDLTGNARNIVKLTLNGREIQTNESGEFTQTLVLTNGYTIMELTAQDRFGRTTSVQRTYVYVPPLSS